MKSADRSLAVLDFLAGYPEGASFQEIATALALPRSSAHGLLHTLLGRRYVELSDGGAGRDRRYRLGPKLAELSASFYQGHGLLAGARASLRDLAAQSGETAYLVVLDGTDALYLHLEEGSHDVRLALAPGRRLPAHATAAGKALLACLPDDQVRRLYDAPEGAGRRLATPGPRTTATLAGLLRELEEPRRLGHAHDVEEGLPGVHSVAAAVVGADGAGTAALSISLPAARVDGERLVRLARLVRERAAGVSERAHPGAAAPATRPARRRPAPGGWRAGRVRVGWAMGQMRPAYFVDMQRTVQELAPAAGADVLWLDARDDEHKQACDVAHLLDAGVDVLVLHPVHTVRSDALFRAAAGAGVPSICFRRPARSDAFSLFAGGDTFQEGRLQVEWVAGRLDGRGSVVLLEGDPFNDNARNIAGGNRDALSRYPGLTVVADEVCPDWSPAHAERVADELLGRSTGAGGGAVAGAAGIDAFVCANDGIARGAIAALRRRGLAGRVLVVGGDGTADAVVRLRDGTQHATVFLDPVALAGQTLAAAVALARRTLDLERLPRRSPAVSPPSRAVPVLDVPLRLITREQLGDL